MTRLFEVTAEAEADGGLLSDRIRNALTDEIASGALAAGSALEEQQLADRFGASRTPVREALRQLVVSGLVEVRGRRGVVVARMTPERIMDMFETSAEAEAMCVRLATYRMTPLERSHLIELHEASRAMVEASNVDAYDAFNREFHECIYRATHNSFLAEQAQAVRSRLSGFRRTQLRQGDRIRRSREEHEAIMQAIAEGDGDTAARRMRAHMLNAATALRRYIDDRFGGAGSRGEAEDSAPDGV
ncbi:GntR family transcriptional regulator [Bradyrhizobium sp. ARR65]|uniref:GntR family transcriptional regulator n=1 Tax=Bradyrhizobium sp. ARR65 TaxID=1040989 RepID=UPI0004677DC0|nr:GntR family transcriptional regulator [Bradyrhizobium sp. ARR65]